MNNLEKFKEVISRESQECIEWEATPSDRKWNYGRITFEGKRWLAHRLSYFLMRKEYRLEMIVCHKCDNPACVNPNHLFLGTQSDNINDMYAKRRGNKPNGTSRPDSKLKEEEVRQIRINPLSSRKLGIRYNVSHTTILKIKSKKKWKHLL